MYTEIIEPLVSLCARDELFNVQRENQMITISERAGFSIKPQKKVELWNQIIWFIDSEPLWLTMPYFEDLDEPGDCLGEVSLRTTCYSLVVPELINLRGTNYLKGSVKINLDSQYVNYVDEMTRFKCIFEGKDIFNWAFNYADIWAEDRLNSTNAFIFIPVTGIKKIQLKVEPC